MGQAVRQRDSCLFCLTAVIVSCALFSFAVITRPAVDLWLFMPILHSGLSDGKDVAGMAVYTVLIFTMHIKVWFAGFSPPFVSFWRHTRRMTMLPRSTSFQLPYSSAACT